MIGPPCGAYNPSDLNKLTIFVVKFCIWYCHKPKKGCQITSNRSHFFICLGVLCSWSRMFSFCTVKWYTSVSGSYFGSSFTHQYIWNFTFYFWVTFPHFQTDSSHLFVHWKRKKRSKICITLKGSLSGRKTIPGTSCSQNGRPLQQQINSVSIQSITRCYSLS